jgi:prepilin-type N-terminal cleavage/methylation domain-containing protein
MFHFNSLGLGLPKHKKAQNIIKGFSLIELIVVMAIMAVLMALTGGLATNNISKRDRLVEIEKVAQIFKRLSYQAYYTGYDIEVRLTGNTFIVNSHNQRKVVEFKQLNFIDTTYMVSTKAFVSPNMYRVSWRDSHRDFPIEAMFKPHEN